MEFFSHLNFCNLNLTDMKNLSIPDPEAAAAVVVVSNKKVEKVKSKKGEIDISMSDKHSLY